METFFGGNFESFSGKKCILGVDEAGRGPVLGPMVYCCGICIEDSGDLLKQLGVDDSKALTEEKREDIFGRIENADDASTDCFSYILQEFSARYISNRMLQRCKCSLNEISHKAAIDMIQLCLDARIIVQQVFIDTVGPADTYQEKLLKIYPQLKITVAKKADSLYPVVSAASICAKVSRDRMIKDWKFPEQPGNTLDIPENGWGSGYPADPDTKKFMESCVEPVFGYPSLVRFSWSTAQSLLDKSAVKVRWCDEEANGASKSLANFFSKKGEIPVVQRHAYFVDRHLYSATSF